MRWSSDDSVLHQNESILIVHQPPTCIREITDRDSSVSKGEEEHDLQIPMAPCDYIDPIHIYKLSSQNMHPQLSEVLHHG